MSSAALGNPAGKTHLHAATPRFWGIIRGEFFKIRRMRSTWITFFLLLAIICLPYLVTMGVSSVKDALQAAPLVALYQEMSTNLMVLRIFIGFFLIVLTANVFGREYQAGTIRILLARGVGRLQLLFGKLLTVVLVALGVFIVCLLVNVVMALLLLLVKVGNLDALKVLDGDFWHNTWLYILTVLISMGVTILMAMAVTVVGRSLSFGLSAALAWFPADNIAVIFMILGYRLTKNDFWRNITAYFLGPNLNQMPTAILPTKAFAINIGSQPLVNVDGTHTLLVALVYAVIFAAVAVVLTWKRDVKE